MKLRVILALASLLVAFNVGAIIAADTYPMEREPNPNHEPRQIQYHNANGLTDADRKELHGLAVAISLIINSEGDTIKVEDKTVDKAPLLAALMERRAMIMQKWKPQLWTEERAKLPAPAAK